MPAEPHYHVYIMASKSRVIYIGMTGSLMSRVLRHKSGEGGAFTKRYRVHRLVYREFFQNAGKAIARETEMKKWRREKKVALIEKENPTWEDLAEGWDAPAIMTQRPPSEESLSNATTMSFRTRPKAG
jgi:putative endonuclease